MKNEKGVLTRPSSRLLKRDDKKPVFLVGLLSILLIVTYLFTFKTYEPVANIMISGGILIYPFTFLITAYIAKYYGFKEAKRSIFTSTGLFAVFILLVMICIIPTPNNQTSSYNAVIQYLFANDFIMIGDTRIFFPLLGQFFGLCIAFIVSHLLYVTIYNAVHRYTSDYLAMGLSAFIGAIIDRIIFMPLLFLENLIDGSNTFEYFIKCLTSEFMATILSILIIIIVYMIVCAIKDSKKKKQLI